MDFIATLLSIVYLLKLASKRETCFFRNQTLAKKKNVFLDELFLRIN